MVRSVPMTDGATRSPGRTPSCQDDDCELEDCAGLGLFTEGGTETGVATVSRSFFLILSMTSHLRYAGDKLQGTPFTSKLPDVPSRVGPKTSHPNMGILAGHESTSESTQWLTATGTEFRLLRDFCNSKCDRDDNVEINHSYPCNFGIGLGMIEAGRPTEGAA
jgi:hypothetical protein